MSELSWENDLALGDAGESAIYKLIGDAEAIVTTGFFKDYDIILNDGRTIEVKTDAKMHKTGNHIVEYGCNGELSGIAATKAEFWVVLDGELAYFCHSKDIKDKARDGVRKEWVSHEGKKMRGSLLDKNTFLPLCRKIYQCKVDISGR